MTESAQPVQQLSTSMLASSILQNTGNNFIEIMFKHVMEKGWKGVSILLLFQLWAYHSMDKLNLVFSCLDDKLATLYMFIVKFVGDNLYNQSVKLVKWGPSESNKLQEKPKLVEIPKFTKKSFEIIIDQKNKIDLMAIVDFMMKRDYLKVKSYKRVGTTKYSVTERYILSDTIKWTDSRVEITLFNNVNMYVDYETDNASKVLKDVNFGNDTCSGVIDITPQDFANLVDSTIRSFDNDVYIRRGPNSMSNWMYGNWHCCQSIFNSELVELQRMIHYKDDISQFKNLIRFLAGYDKFSFNGKVYKCSGNWSDMPSFFGRASDSSELDKIIKKFLDSSEFKEYVIDLKSSIDKSGHSEIARYINDNYDKLFNKVIAGKISLTFNTVDKAKDLDAYSRKYMDNIILQYYNQTKTKSGGKIPVYNLTIGYDITVEKKENPKYTAWKKIKDDEDEEELLKDLDKGKDNDDEEDNDEDKVKKKPVKKKRLPRLNHQYGGAYYGGTQFYPPVQFIETEKKIPKIVSERIKSDRKPFEYLYLQKDFKETLRSYLVNFKDGKAQYEKFGIPYKGGILMSGDPGCGKTSTILAIGTYLSKNIYYVDLNAVTTNEELKLLIDHIKTTSNNGGLVVFEDIDCMTDVVLKRGGESTSNDKLTLSFILNLLDGTMSPEDIIFIMTTNHVDKLDTALIRPGRMDIKVELSKCDKKQLHDIYKDLMGVQLDSNILDRFPENTYMVSEVILHIFHNQYNKEFSPDRILHKFLEV